MKYIVENSIVINGEIIDYIIDYKNIKNMYFRFDNSGILHISANKLLSKKYIESILIKNYKSISRLKVKTENKISEPLCYLGNPLNLIKYSGKIFMDDDDIYAENEDEAKKYLYSISLNVFESRLRQIEKSFSDLPNFKLKSRLMKTKWGVCNTKSMTVTLNQSLIFKDVHLIDYVIVHELCHFKHMNHSNAFWDEVAKHYPYYKQARKELNY